MSDAAPPTAEAQVFVARQPIVDRSGAIVAYELLFRSGDGGPRPGTLDPLASTAAVIARAIGEMELDNVLGPHSAYINCSAEMLSSDLLELLKPQRFVLEILETVRFDAELQTHCETLRAAGFRLALDDVAELTPDVERFLPLVDVVKIDWPFAKPQTLRPLIELAKRRRKLLLAEKIETREEHAAALQLGCDLFQGYYFAKPQLLASRRSPTSLDALLRLMRLLTREPEVAELERELKNTPAFVVQLLRLVNAAGNRRGKSIASLREAIMLLGIRQITRWAQLVLYADGSNLPVGAHPLVQLVRTRAALMETAARELRPDDAAFAGSAYMAGVFSLMHVAFGMTPDDLTARLALAPSIRDAIVVGSGPLGELLRLAEAVERGDFTRAEAAARRLSAALPESLARLATAALAQE